MLRNEPCPLIAELLNRWRESGDTIARDRLLRSVARAPCDIWLEVRDEHIAQLAQWVRDRVNGAPSIGFLAELIADAGACVQSTPPRKFYKDRLYDGLDKEERKEFAKRISTILNLRPTNCKQDWPKERQIRSILDFAKAH